MLLQCDHYSQVIQLPNKSKKLGGNPIETRNITIPRGIVSPPLSLVLVAFLLDPSPCTLESSPDIDIH